MGNIPRGKRSSKADTSITATPFFFVFFLFVCQRLHWLAGLLACWLVGLLAGLLACLLTACCSQPPPPVHGTHGQHTTTTEACAQAASNLTNANAEFVRQALIAPTTVSEILHILYLGGDSGSVGGLDGGGGEGLGAGVRDRGRKRAAACRLNSARVLRSIFSEADAADVARWV